MGGKDGRACIASPIRCAIRGSPTGCCPGPAGRRSCCCCSASGSPCSWRRADYQQGEAYRIMFVHVPAAWMALMVYAMMAAASVVGPGLAPSARRGGGARGGADRGRLHRDRAGHRQPLGQADVGHLLGLGRAPHLGPDPVLPLSRLHRALRGVRRSAPRRPRRLDPLPGRLGQPADHQVLGRLVEHAASTEHLRPGRVRPSIRACSGRCS